jgi:hypothetical protein
MRADEVADRFGEVLGLAGGGGDHENCSEPAGLLGERFGEEGAQCRRRRQVKGEQLVAALQGGGEYRLGGHDACQRGQGHGGGLLSRQHEVPPASG